MAATAAIYGVGFCSFSDNLSTKKLIKRRGNGSIIGVRSICSRREVGSVVRCSSSSKAVAPLESEGDGRRCVIEEDEEEGGGGDVMRFKMSDFKVLDRVSIGLGGRYHGSFSLRHWLQQSDWLPTLEANLALDEESVRRMGDDTVGGPAVSRQLQITQFFFETLASTIRLASYLGSQYCNG